MELEIIYGRAGTGKTTGCFDQIKERMEQKTFEKLFYIVPEQFTYQSDIDLSAFLHNKGMLQAEVLSFMRLAYKLANEVEGRTKKRIDETAKLMILFDILKKEEDHFQIYNTASKKRGFVPRISNLISELKRYNILPSDLKNESEDKDLLSVKIEELSAIYEKYLDVLGSAYYDFEDELTLLSKNIFLSEPMRGATIWVDGFNGFTEQESLVLENLLSICRKVVLTVTSDDISRDASSIKSTDVFYASKRTAAHMISIAEKINAKISLTNMNGKTPYRFINNPELAHLEKSMLSYTYSRFPDPTKNVMIYTGSTIYDEVGYVSGQIIALVKHGNMLYRDISVVCGQLEAYKGMISSVFKFYDIPYYLDNKTAMTENKIVIMFLSAIKAISTGWKYEDMFTYIRCGFSGISDDEADMLEEYVLENNIKGSKWTKKEWGNLDYLRLKVVTPLKSLWERLAGGKSVKQLSSSIYDFLTEIDVQGQLEEMLTYLNKNSMFKQAREQVQAWNAIMTVLDRAVEGFGEHKYTLSAFAEMLSVAFEAQTLGTVPTTKDQVIVGTPERSKSHKVKVLFVLGANDGTFPQLAKDDGIFNDPERERLKNKGITLAPTAVEKLYEEQLLIYKTLTAPTEKLIISHALANSEGKSIRPSPVLSKIRKRFPHIQHKSNMIQDKTDIVLSAQKPAFNSFIRGLSALRDGKELPEGYKELYRWFECNYPEKTFSMMGRFDYRKGIEKMSRSAAKKLYRDNMRSSVSQIEQYSKCPFSFFMKYGLGIKERKTFSFRAIDRGTLLHEVLEMYCKSIADENMAWEDISRDASDRRIDQILEEKFKINENTPLSDTTSYVFIKNNIKKTLMDTAWMCVCNLADSEFRPAAFELPFGENTPLNGLELKTSNTKVIFRGKIDRIDTFEHKGKLYIRIIDYKSGTKSFDLSKVYNGLELQLFTYMDLIITQWKKERNTEVIPSGIFYQTVTEEMINTDRNIDDDSLKQKKRAKYKLSGLALDNYDVIRKMDKSTETGISKTIPVQFLKNGSIKGSLANAEQFDRMGAYVRRYITENIESIAKGVCKIYPCKDGLWNACMWCVYDGICQFDAKAPQDNYRKAIPLKAEEIWHKISEGETEDDGNDLD